MYARLVSAQVVTDKINEGITIWKERDMPLMETVKGYRGAYLLTNRNTGKVISMTLWDREEDAVTDEKSPLHQKQVDMFADLLIGEPVAQYYEVSAKDKLS